MTNKKQIYIGIPATLVFLVGVFFLTRWLITPPSKPSVHYHAGFVVFENNKKLDFSDSKYMYIEPCTSGDKTNDTPAQVQIEKAHLHDNIGDLIHIEQAGAIWQNLFTNMGFVMNYSSTTGFINGKTTTEWQLQPIKPFDSLVVFIGNEDPKLLQQAVTKDYMMAQANKSTTCGG